MTICFISTCFAQGTGSPSSEVALPVSGLPIKADWKPDDVALQEQQTQQFQKTAVQKDRRLSRAGA